MKKGMLCFLFAFVLAVSIPVAAFAFDLAIWDFDDNCTKQRWRSDTDTSERCNLVFTGENEDIFFCMNYDGYGDTWSWNPEEKRLEATSNSDTHRNQEDRGDALEKNWFETPVLTLPGEEGAASRLLLKVGAIGDIRYRIYAFLESDYSFTSVFTDWTVFNPELTYPNPRPDMEDDHTGATLCDLTELSDSSQTLDLEIPSFLNGKNVRFYVLLCSYGNTSGTMWVDDMSVVSDIPGFDVYFNPNGGACDPESARTDVNGRLSGLPVPTTTDKSKAFKGWYTQASGGTWVDTDTVYTKDTTIYAQWYDCYTISFDANGGSCDPTSVKTGENKKLSELPVPVHAEGRGFTGWYTQAVGGEKIETSRTYTGHTTVYAHWASFTVQPEGGSVARESDWLNVTWATDFTPVKLGVLLFGRLYITYSVPTITSDTFSSKSDSYQIRAWYGSGDEDYIDSNEFYVTLNSTDPISYTVTVETDGNGTASADPVSAAKGETVTLTATPDTGYHFKEWQSSDVTVSGNTFTMPEKDVTVMAIFEADAPVAYTVSFNMNGHGNQVTAQTVREGNKATRPADPTAEGWTFDGWYADAAFSIAFDFNTAIHADITVYAKWTENTMPPSPVYTVIAGANGKWTKGATTGLAFTSDAPFDKFDSVQVDGGTVTAANYTAEAGSTRITLTPAYLETLSVGSHSVKIVSSDGSASTNFTVNQAPVPKTYTVIFNMNGHGDQITSQKIQEGGKAVRPADPTAKDYIFIGWYKDNTFSAKYDFNAVVTANITLYANWAGIPPKTGDNTPVLLLMVLMVVSTAALTGTVVNRKKNIKR